MEKIITIKNEYNSLDTLCAILNKESIFDCYIDYDIWELRTKTNRHLEPCIILKKSKMHAIKLYFVNENTVKVDYIIPSKVMNAYFGKRPMIRQDIIERVIAKIKEAILVSPQQKAFEELENEVRKVALKKRILLVLNLY